MVKVAKLLLKKSSKWVKSSKYEILIAFCLIALVIDINYLIKNNNVAYRHQVFISKIKSLAQNPNFKPSTPANKSSNYLTDYHVPADDPRLIIIPKINLDTRVISTGVNSQNQIGTPPDSIETAWFRESSLPGSPGATFIDGHVDGWYVPGVFYNLKDLTPGDKIEILTGNNTLYTYVVVKLQTYNANSVDMAQVLSPINPNLPGLNLMTCTGGLINNNTDFNQRLVVFSSLQT
jgi:sortase (surface protein transpeptidase)